MLTTCHLESLGGCVGLGWAALPSSGPLRCPLLPTDESTMFQSECAHPGRFIAAPLLMLPLEMLLLLLLLQCEHGG